MDLGRGQHAGPGSPSGRGILPPPMNQAILIVPPSSILDLLHLAARCGRPSSGTPQAFRRFPLGQPSVWRMASGSALPGQPGRRCAQVPVFKDRHSPAPPAPKNLRESPPPRRGGVGNGDAMCCISITSSTVSTGLSITSANSTGVTSGPAGHTTRRRKPQPPDHLGAAAGQIDEPGLSRK